jgi:hypothetical protein
MERSPATLEWTRYGAGIALLRAAPPRTLEPPRLLDVRYQRGRGLVVRARFVCSHEQTVIFPHAGRKVSRHSLFTWTFGPNLDELCTRCTPNLRP